jgi:MYXO-CTERM domain-containing protein
MRIPYLLPLVLLACDLPDVDAEDPCGVAGCGETGDTPADAVDTPEDTEQDTVDTPEDTGDGNGDGDTDPPADTADTDVPVSIETGDTGGGPVGPSCAQLLSWSPADGATDVSRTTSVEATFDRVDPSASMSVFAGAAVAGAQSWNGTTLTFTPTNSLLAGTDYTSIVTTACGQESIGFTTESVGGPITGASLVDRTWELDVYSGTWIAPAGVGPILAGLAGDGTILLGVSHAGTNNLDLVFSGADETTTPTTQDTDWETVDITAVDFSQSPTFSGSFGSLTLDLAGVAVPVEQVAFSGTFDAGGSQIVDMSVTGFVDIRPAGPLLGGTAQTSCLLLGAFGVGCTACPSGVGNFCVEADIRDITAFELVGQTITPIATTSAGASCSSAGGASAGWWVVGVGLLAYRRRQR